MTYNLHPLFVHFPIALLFVYSLVQILPVKRFISSVNWPVVGRIFLIVGVLGALVSLATGEVAEHLVRPNHDVVELHAGFAALTTWLYVFLLVQEMLTVYITTRLSSPLCKLQKILSNRVLVILISIIALGTLTVTGILGGVMVHGISSDPLAPVLLKLFGIDF